MNALTHKLRPAVDLAALYEEFTHSTNGVRVWNDRACEVGLSDAQSAHYGDIARLRQIDVDEHRDQIRAAVMAMSGLSLEQLREVIS